MYIIKAGMSSTSSGPFTPKDGYTQVDTLEEAEAIYIDMIERFPSIDIQIFSAVEIHMPPEIKQKALDEKARAEQIQMYMNRRHLDFLEIVEADGNSKQYSAHP